MCSFFYAGLFMTLAFNWCLVKGETFSATVFGSFGGFYLSYGAILTPVSPSHQSNIRSILWFKRASG